jgi:hypothetical protein
MAVQTTDTEISSSLGLTAQATAAVPVVGQLTAIASSIANIFTSAHSAAVAKEGQVMNDALPTFIGLVQQVMSAANSGAITPTQAVAYLQQAQADFYTTVQGIIKKSGTCSTSGLDAGKLDSYGCATTSDPCNNACCNGCNMVEPTVRNLTAILNAGGGSYLIPATSGQGAVQGTSSVSISYQTPNKLAIIDGAATGTVAPSSASSALAAFTSTPTGTIELFAIIGGAMLFIVLLVALLVGGSK